MIDGTNTSNKTYAGSFVYNDEGLEYALFDEGRLLKDANGIYEYQYFLKVVAKRKSRFIGNHLGNTRVTFSSNTGLIQQQDHYYPFGMNFAGINTTASSTENFYRYNGKELQKDLDLNWYDYGARMLDVQIGRWHSIDPLAESMNSWSPYNYTFNNPLKFIDPNGMSPDIYEADPSGYVKLAEKTKDEYDIVYVVDENGKRKDQDNNGEINEQDGQKVNDKSLLPQLTESKADGKQKDWLTGNELQGHYTKFGDGKEGENLFKFLSKNTDVEWTFQESVGNKNIIGTLHEGSQAFDVYGFEGFGRKSVKTHWHSHSGSASYDFMPSDSDRFNADRTWAVNPNAKYYIYMPKITKKAYNKVNPDSPINYEPSTIYTISK